MNGNSNRKREGGSALFVAMLMLVLMGFLGIAALDTVTRDRQVAGYQNRARTALYAAEAGVADARDRVRQVESTAAVPAFPFTPGAPRVLSDAGLYNYEAGQLPSYFADPAFPLPIAHAKDGNVPCPGFNAGATSTLIPTLWQINVVGRSPDGSIARLDVVETKCLGGSQTHGGASYN